MTYHLIFSRKLYLGKSIVPKKLDKLKKRLEEKPLLAKVYLLVPARNKEDQLDMFDARQLALPQYRDAEIHIIGLASGYEEALQVVESIVQECLAARGDCNLREYLSC